MWRPVFLWNGKVDGALIELRALQVVETEKVPIEIAEVLRRNYTRTYDDQEGYGGEGRRGREEDTHLRSHGCKGCISNAHRPLPSYTMG